MESAKTLVYFLMFLFYKYFERGLSLVWTASSCFTQTFETVFEVPSSNQGEFSGSHYAL